MHLYLHIPFCKQKCSYCNFHFSTSFQQKAEMVEAICKELKLRQHEIKKPLETIYLGGGTPSVLNASEFYQIFHQIETLFEIAPNAEITLEANPDDLNASKVKEIRQSPINRLSMGVQSFFDKDLKLMNRAHTAQEADASIKRSQDAGIENISIDLIYGSPTTTSEMWSKNLKKAIDLKVPHVSSYALTIEPKTIIQHQINKGIIADVDEEKQQHQFQMMVETLTSHGFDHYEISNFGKPDFYSKHNTSYWLGKLYTGVGPSAHGYNGRERYWNIANNIKYIQSIQQNKLNQEREILTPNDILNELTMIGLRTVYGIDLEHLKNQIPEELFAEWHENTKQFIEQGKLILKENKLYLNPKFRFFADGIASDLFIV